MPQIDPMKPVVFACFDDEGGPPRTAEQRHRRRYGRPARANGEIAAGLRTAIDALKLPPIVPPNSDAGEPMVDASPDLLEMVRVSARRAAAVPPAEFATSFLAQLKARGYVVTPDRTN